MKRTCLFTKSADNIEKAVEAATSNSDTTNINTTDNSNWFDRNQQKIGVGMMGLGSGMLLATYIMQKAHAKDMRRLLLKAENQKEENNKTV